jgi:hypothetical protein
MKRIYISIDLAKRAIEDKDFLESLAFNVLIKWKYTSSTINNATVRRCKGLFGMGSTRICRIIKNGLEYGLLERFGNHIIAKKIKKEEGFNAVLEFESDKEYRISEVIDMIRNTVLLDHIRKQTFVVDTLRKAREPRNLKEYRAAKKILKRMPHLTEQNYSFGLSNRRIMEVTNVKRYRAKILIRKLVANGKVKAKEVIRETAIKPEAFTKDFRKWCKSTEMRGFLFLRKQDNVICCQLSNCYQYNCDDIQWI